MVTLALSRKMHGFKWVSLSYGPKLASTLLGSTERPLSL